jgi:calcineurin-like phosphoesterase family protein
MSNRFVISDTHFGHTNSWAKFKRADGTPLRAFESTEEMDETMVSRWNAVVNQRDTVYHCGDVVINRKSLQIIKRLNGRKILIRGNHDIFRDEDYREVGFEQIHGVRVFTDQFILSHIPLHPDSVSERFRVNVHGHLHSHEVMLNEEIDPRYICVSVEHTDYAPISFDQLEFRIQRRWGLTGYNPPVRTRAV